MIFSRRLIENPYLVTLVGPWISLLPKTTIIYQLDNAYMLETQMSIDFLDSKVNLKFKTLCKVIKPYAYEIEIILVAISR